MVHHFLNRRKAYGKCVACKRGFGNWKKFSGRDLIGISCSWCGDSYHMTCFNDALRREQCTFGPLRNLIIPPSWVVKTPIIEQVYVVGMDVCECVMMCIQYPACSSPPLRMIQLLPNLLGGNLDGAGERNQRRGCPNTLL